VAETRRDVGDREIMLGLLASIERDSGVTQRKLAGELGIALGLANSYLRRCVRKGLVKMSQVPLNRYAYYLTPQGFAEKSRLTAEYLTTSFKFFRRARADCTALLSQCRARGLHKVALFGAGDLAEIAVLSAGDSGVEIVCVVDARLAGRHCAGVPVVADLAAARLAAGMDGLDGVILTDTNAPQTCFEGLLSSVAAHRFAPARILAPSLLGVSQPPPAAAAYTIVGQKGDP
jgi:DNA-binding MarR family transcriptional regulator